MTIKEYKETFVKLLKQMEEEHGPVESVELCKKKFDYLADSIVCKITF